MIKPISTLFAIPQNIFVDVEESSSSEDLEATKELFLIETMLMNLKKATFAIFKMT